MASPNNTLKFSDISDVMSLLCKMKKQNDDILTKLNSIEDDNRKLRQELLETRSSQRHNIKVPSRERECYKPEYEDETEKYQNEQSNSNKKVRVSVASLPEPPASFNTLDDDCLGNVLDFVGKKCYSVFGRVNKRCHEVFSTRGLPKLSYLYGYAPLHIVQQQEGRWYCESGFSKGVLHFNRRDIFEWILADESDHYYFNLGILCYDSIKESRLDILREVFRRATVQQLADLRNDGTGLCTMAAEHSKLEVLKFLRENECEWCSRTWILAERKGHEHILEYLRNNGYPAEWQEDSDSDSDSDESYNFFAET